MNDQIDDYIFFNLEHLKEKIKGIKIQQYDKNYILINEFDSIREASRITNIART